MELIGWALTSYRAAEQGDVSGFVFSGFSPVLPAINSSWATFKSQYWARPSAGRTTTQAVQR